jgi:preprotein translocase subunit SecA
VSLLKTILGDSNEREIGRLRKVVAEINALEPEAQAASDAELRGRTEAFRGRVAAGREEGAEAAELENLLPEAFATVREAARRTLGQRPFDVQLMGGAVLHHGRVAEMKTGEGKTLVATMPVYLNALTGRGVHVVTVNDYLAKRDSEWMGAIYRFLGLTVGCVVHELDATQRREAYASDVTYGTNTEFGFDYLRDNMALGLDQMVQRGLYYAIVDEVDSILIDEARTPLIISGQAMESTEKYKAFAHHVAQLDPELHFTVDEKTRTAALTEEGVARMEELSGIPNIYDDEHLEEAHQVNQALKARTLFQLDHEYVVQDGEVIIVDEFTGRLQFGRRYSDGLHQAIEAKEGVVVQQEMVTMATISYQNYFRLYEKLAGMTGTAVTEAEELSKIYHLEVVVVPTNMPMIRSERPDLIYRTAAGKLRAVVEEIVECHDRGQPVLVGTVSIERNEELARQLEKRGVPHQVLNAKQHAREAEIIKQAGQPGAVTIATNMAGRGTDIVLGEGVPGLGGLHVIGTERHESRRIDNQLRGRSGRQGDPGSSRFYASLEDDLLRIFGANERMQGLLSRLGFDDDNPIESGMVTKTMEGAQAKVEGNNFDARKHLVEYDDVMNEQREVIYGERRKILEGTDLRANLLGMLREDVAKLVAVYCSARDSEEWEVDALIQDLRAIFPLPAQLDEAEMRGMGPEGLTEHLAALGEQAYAGREAQWGPELSRQIEQFVMLRTIDSLWVDYLTAMQHLRESVGLHGYAQQDPLVVFKQEAFQAFEDLKTSMQSQMVRNFFRVQATTPPPPPTVGLMSPPAPDSAPGPNGGGPTTSGSGATVSAHTSGRAETVGAGVKLRGAPAPLPRPVVGGGQGSSPVVSKTAKVGRNDPCPCGSGLKYKKCHGR